MMERLGVVLLYSGVAVILLLIPGVYSSKEHSQGHQIDRFRDFNELTSFIMRTLSDVTPRLEDDVRHLVDRFESDDYIPDDVTIKVCPEQTLSSTEILDSWRKLAEPAADGCTDCINFFSVLKNISCAVDNYALLETLLIRFCEEVFMEQGDRDPIMCNNTVRLQGPYGYATLIEVPPAEYCEAINRCFPPPKPSQKTSVYEKIARLSAASEMPRSETATDQNSNKADVRVVQLTDIHIQMLHSVGSATDCDVYVCCLEQYGGQGSAREWGEYTCNLPLKTYQVILDKVAELQPDFVIFTGDTAPHTFWDETVSSQLNCSTIVADNIASKLPGVHVFPTIGNHELYPSNIATLRADDTKSILNGLTDIWKAQAEFGEDQETSMRYLGYYSMLVPGYSKLRMLSLNTNHYWGTMNLMAAINRNTTEEGVQRNFVEQTLASARIAGEKVIVLSHHPLASSGNIVRATRWWEQMARKYSDVITLHLSGHTHSDEFHLILDPDLEEPTALGLNLVAPSVTSNTYVNPTVRMLTLSGDDYTLLNYQNFYIDVDLQKPGVPPVMVKNYDARELYGIPDVTPQSMLDLTLKLFEGNDELFQKYYDNRNAKATKDSCSDSCKISYLCGMWFPNWDEVEECIGVLTLPQPKPTTGSASYCQANTLVATLSFVLYFVMTTL